MANRFLMHHAAVLLAVGCAAAFPALVSVEWTLPYCSDPQDGAAFAAFGAPLPFQRYGGVSSMEFDFMPHAYLANVLLLAIAFLATARLALRALSIPVTERGALAAGAVGAALIALSMAGVGVLVAQGMWRSVLSIGDESYGRFLEFRPIGIAGSVRAVACKPSGFWFPNGWHAR